MFQTSCSFNYFIRLCLECSCNQVGSYGNDCQNITGQCSCKPNVIGRICSDCAENTFNFGSGNGCELCQCNMPGSVSQQCNVVSGQVVDCSLAW